ncbi:MAG: hypothetical protein E7Z89_08405 [Cyanobacteria bacterium SIG28]|nr:hypothetical protein [Cyanobacteria bacterium SIG28]
MDKKCSKYEGLFVFSDEETLMKHIEECPECKAEHEKMEKVSGLISEVKFYYRSKKRRVMKLKAVCALLMFMFFSATYGVITNDGDLMDSLMYGETLSAEDLGFPVDSYGLLMVDDEF